MKLIITSILAVFLSISFAQLQTKDAYISFFSEKESIKAENSEVEGSLDVSTGELTFTVSIEKFIFPFTVTLYSPSAV